MTSAASIVSDAYREGNITAIGAAPTANQLTEGLNALNRIVESVYGFDLGEGLQDWQSPQPQRTALVAANYPQAPYPIGQDATILPFPLATEQDLWVTPFPPKNSRIIWGGSTMTVWLPEQPDNGSRMGLVQGSGKGDAGVDGNILTIDGNGRYVGAPGQSQQNYVFSYETPLPPVFWIYLSHTGGWSPLAPLGSGDNMIFPAKFDDFWITALSMRLAPKYNKIISEATKATFAEMYVKIKTEYRQNDVTVYGAFDFPRSLQSYIAGRWFY
jgi:hypothetical protein